MQMEMNAVVCFSLAPDAGRGGFGIFCSKRVIIPVSRPPSLAAASFDLRHDGRACVASVGAGFDAF